MAIFGAIPMPQNSGDVMSGHVNNMIKQLMDRQHQEQQNKQYQSTLAQQQLQHQDSMGLQRAAAGRAAQAAADAHAKAMFDRDPAAQYKLMQDMMNLAGGGQPYDGGMQMPQQTQQPGVIGGGQPQMGSQPQPQHPQDFQGVGGQQALQQQQQVSAPSLANLDINKMNPMQLAIAKKFMPGMFTETPQMKSDRKGREATQVLDIKERRDLERELPVVEDKLKSIDELIKLTKDAPNDWFGAGVGGFDVLGGPGQRKRGMTDKRYGTMETLFGDLIAPQAQEFSSKGLASALKMATEIKPGFGENKNIALGKLEHIKKKMKEAYAREQSRLGRVGGKVAPRDWSHLSNEELQRLAGQ